MDGIYHQFVNDKKQNHFIHAERHRPHFVHSEGKDKRNRKATVKKIRRHLTLEDKKRLKRIDDEYKRHMALNRTGGIGHKGVKGESLRINGSSDDEDGSSDEDGTGGTGHKGGKGESWRKEDASPSTGGIGHKGVKGESLRINGSSDDEDGSSDEDGTGGTGHKGGKGESWRKEDASPSTGGIGHKGVKGELYRKSFKKNDDENVGTYHDCMIRPIANREINACISANNVLQNKREIYSKYLEGDKVLVTLYHKAWQVIPKDYDNKIEISSSDEEKKRCVNKNPIVQLLKKGPRYLQYESNSETSWVFTVFDGSGNQSKESVPGKWIYVHPPELMNKPPIYPLRNLQLIDVKYKEGNNNVTWIGRYVELESGIFVCHSDNKNNTGNIMQLIIGNETLKLTPFNPYGEDNNPNKYQELNKNDFHEFGSDSDAWKHHDQPFIKQGDVLEINNGNIWDRVYISDDNIDAYGELYHRVRYLNIDENGNKISHPDRASKTVKERDGNYSDSDDSDDSAPDDYDDSGLDDTMQISQELDVWIDEYRVLGHWDELYGKKYPPLYGTKKEEIVSSDDEEDDEEDEGDDQNFKLGDTYQGLIPRYDKPEYPHPQPNQKDKKDQMDSDEESDEED
jgi:hypothetical protein